MGNISAIFVKVIPPRPKNIKMDYKAESERRPLKPEEEQQLRQIVVVRAPAALEQAAQARDDRSLFYALPGAAFAAFHLERYDLAEEYALRALGLAPAYRDDWNYGNAIHAARTIFGLLALMRGDLPDAVRQLHLAGETPGSPQLGSFGPTMQLAKELLRRGERQAVLEYLAQCRAFWSMGKEWLALWEAKILAGRLPNFSHHSFG